MLKHRLAAALVALAGGALWIEQSHRIVIDAPAAGPALAAAEVCPDNDTVPYDRNCLDFLAVPAEPAPRLQVMAIASPAVNPTAAACPNTDQVPYSAGCLAYLMGPPKRECAGG